MKFLFPSALLFILLISSDSASAQTSQVKMDSLATNLGETFMKDKQAVGLSIGVYNNGNISFYNFGSTEKGKSLKPTQNTVYEIGSVTKAFVSLILANAVLEKKIHLSDDIKKYLDGSYPNLEYNKRPVTVEHLANSTSGIPNWLPATPQEILNAPEDSTAFLRDRIYGAYTNKDFFDALHKVELDTIPGFKSRHSNAAAQLLACILEKVYGTSIDKLVKKYVSGPNKMNNTSFLASTSNNKSLAVGYNEKGIQMPYFTASSMKGVGGLNSTTADLVNFIRLQLNKNNKAVALTHKQSFNAGYYSIGLTWLRYKHANGNHQVWTDGGTYGFVSYIVFYPEINSGVVVLSNESDDTAPGKLGNIAYQLFDLMQKK
ncbi:MAG: serine hydrolase domain-containing protein [Pseudobacter sp.]|uniref:serine hydrolase domain-containing protein n=1 Tax=Pseudobacter sp. TaxID=2045420 RepID=UPI003F7E4408